MTTVEVHADNDIDDEGQPSYFYGVPTKSILDAVNDCSNWVITIGIACLIASPVILVEPEFGSGSNSSVYAASGLLIAGIFSCAAGITCKATSCYVETEDGISEPQIVGMV